MKDKVYGIFLSLYIFWEPMVYSVLGLLGESISGMIMRLALVAIAAISWALFLRYKKTATDKKMLVFFAVFGCLYLLTGFIFDDKYGASDLYYGNFLRWGADCISACVLGLLFPKVSNYSSIHHTLPFVCCLMTPLLLKELVISRIMSSVIDTENGFNYQNIAYYLAIMYAISTYYFFINRIFRKSIFRWVLFACMLVQGVACAMSGGRGGFVLLMVYTVFLLYIMLKRKIISKGKLLIICIIAACGVACVANLLGLFDSVGFERAKNLAIDDDRKELYENTVEWILKNPFTGFGLGSVWFTTGFYNHNIFLDLLVETGSIGLMLVICFFIKIYKRIKFLTRINDTFYLIMLLFIFGCVQNLVSGYWISTFSHWLAFGCAMSYKYKIKMIRKELAIQKSHKRLV